MMVEIEHAFDLLNQLGLPISANALDACLDDAAKVDCMLIPHLQKIKRRKIWKFSLFRKILLSQCLVNNKKQLR